MNWEYAYLKILLNLIKIVRCRQMEMQDPKEISNLQTG